MDELTASYCAKAMSLWLRHKPERAGLTLNADGWVELSDLLVALEQRELSVTGEDIETLAAGPTASLRGRRWQNKGPIWTYACIGNNSASWYAT